MGKGFNRHVTRSLFAWRALVTCWFIAVYQRLLTWGNMAHSVNSVLLPRLWSDVHTREHQFMFVYPGASLPPICNYGSMGKNIIFEVWASGYVFVSLSLSSPCCPGQRLRLTAPRGLWRHWRDIMMSTTTTLTNVVRVLLVKNTSLYFGEILLRLRGSPTNLH